MKILVPLDGSTTAEAALPLAAELARASGAGLVLLMVMNVHPAPEPAPCEQDLAPIQQAQNYLETARRHLVMTIATSPRPCGVAPLRRRSSAPPRCAAPTGS